VGIRSEDKTSRRAGGTYDWFEPFSAALGDRMPIQSFSLRVRNAMIVKINLGGAIKSLLLAAISVFAWSHSQVAVAEPYLAVQQGYKCVQCHINPTGGGLRNTFGLVFAENAMPLTTLPAGSPVWLGQVVQDIVRVGGDLRAQYFDLETPHNLSQNGFQLEQLRLYADVTVIPNLLGIYVDEQVAPGGATNMEAYARIGNQADWYIKAGQFYLPFGWRLQDQSAFVREATLINMDVPDTGVEFGLERGKWSAQLDVTNGSLNQGKPKGYQVTTNVVRTESSWRVGASGTFTQSSAGDRNQLGAYAGLRTGPVAWLTEIDLIHQQSAITGAATINSPFGTIPTGTSVPAFVEADWAFHRGNNLKLTYDYLDPARRIVGNGVQRFSMVYELTPFPFVQFRAGFRRYDGASQIDSNNIAIGFAELHAFL
jgi:hypothetical protein